MVNKTISHYKILEKLGSGSMGDVYKAEDTKLKRTIALKFLPPELTRDDDARERFVREAQSSSSLDHPNIGTIYEINDVDGHFFIAMAYYTGETLKEKIKSSKSGMDVEEAIDIAIQIGQGLKKAHSKKIIHRDIKPANIILTDEGQAKIIDFGLAKLKGQTLLTQTGSTLGTVAYMSPEQTQGDNVDHQSDIWALGVILYEMLAGEQPFKGDYEQAVMFSIMNEEPEFITKIRNDIPVQMERILKKALAKSPKKRYQTIEEMLNDLNEVVAQIREEGIQTRFLFKLGRKQRKQLYRASVIILMLIVSGIFLWQYNRTQDKPVSIAVLPLENLMGQPEQDYFADGMTEELISKLSRIHTIQVMARTSVLQYKNTQKDIREIGKELNVNYIVEGSVRRSENRLRVNVQLIDVSTGFHLWSDDYGREFKDVFAVQEETALKIAELLDLRLSRQESEAVRKHAAENPEAYDAYLRGWALQKSFVGRSDNPEKLKIAEQHFERALELEPNYPLALSGLSEVIGNSYLLGFNKDEKRIQRSEELALRAIAIDPNCSEGHAALGDVYGVRKEWDKAIEEFKLAIKLNPQNDWAWEELAWAYNSKKPPDGPKAEHAARMAIKINPIWDWGYLQLAWALKNQQRYDEAIENYKHLTLNDGFARSAYRNLGVIYTVQKKYNEALTHFEKVSKRKEDPGLIMLMAISHAGLGNSEKAQALMEDGLSSFGIKSYPYLETEPICAPLRTLPRFKEILEKYKAKKE